MQTNPNASVLKSIVINKLDRLTEINGKLAELRQSYAANRAAILTSEIVAKMAELDALEQAAAKGLTAEAETLTAEIKNDTLEIGETVHAMTALAVYSKGRVAWNSDKLNGYAAAGHPEILSFCEQGKPSVSIRTK